MMVDFKRSVDYFRISNTNNIRKVSFYNLIVHIIIIIVNYSISRKNELLVYHYLLMVISGICIFLCISYMIKPHKIKYFRDLSLPSSLILFSPCYTLLLWILGDDQLHLKIELNYILMITVIVFVTSYIFFNKRIYVKFVTEEYRNQKEIKYSVFKVLPLVVVGKFIVKELNILSYLGVYILPLISVLLCTYIMNAMLFKYKLLKGNEREFLEKWYDEALKYNPINHQKA